MVGSLTALIVMSYIAMVSIPPDPDHLYGDW